MNQGNATGLQKLKDDMVKNSLLEPPEGKQPCQHLDFRPVKEIRTHFGLWTSKIVKIIYVYMCVYVYVCIKADYSGGDGTILYLDYVCNSMSVCVC